LAAYNINQFLFRQLLLFRSTSLDHPSQHIIRETILCILVFRGVHLCCALIDQLCHHGFQCRFGLDEVQVCRDRKPSKWDKRIDEADDLTGERLC
jgi:hypothetical protein